MQPEKIAWYGTLGVILVIVVTMIGRLPPKFAVSIAAVDFIITRGALLFGVYLLWRLVRAYERRAFEPGDAASTTDEEPGA